MNDPLAVRKMVTRHDLHYDFAPASFFEGIPLGNGEMGAMVFFAQDRLVLSLDRTDVWERRADQSLEPGMNFRKALQQAREDSFDPTSRLFDRNRPPDEVWGNKLPLGRVEWKLPAVPASCQARLALYEATFSLEVFFDSGSLAIRGYLHACQNLVFLELESRGEVDLPRYQVSAPHLDEPGRKLMQVWNYPAPEYGERGADRYFTQVYSGNEKYVLCARSQAPTPFRTTCAITTARGGAGDDLPAMAAAFLDERQEHPEKDAAQHTRWWADFWSRSQLSVPDSALERLWYMEIYKLGCNARPDGQPISIMGVWNPDTRIPPCYGDLHHNLETEMNYWPIFASNHIELALPLYDMLVRELPRFEANCREFFGWDGAHLPANMDIHGQGVGFLWFPWNLQMGVGAWLGQHFWLHYLYSGDRDFLRQQAWPYLEAVGRFWLGFLEADADGMLHVPWSYSPEYDDVVRKGRDSAFDLALVRFLFSTIIEAAKVLELDEGAHAPYREALEQLAPLPVDESGIQVYAGRPLEYSHRHFSHLLAIHPLGFLNIEGSPEERELIERSLTHLRQLGTGNWSGWSFPWMALIACRVQRPGMAHAMLRFYTDQVILPSSLQVSVDWRKTGFYTAEHGFINTLEAGFGAAAAIMEMLLQSWGGRIRLFPCLPEEWEEASFETLRAEGAFLVSASFRAGAVEWIRIHSEAGNLCTLQNPWDEGPVTLRDGDTGIATLLEGTDLSFPTTAGGNYQLTGSPPQRATARSRDRLTGLPRWD